VHLSIHYIYQWFLTSGDDGEGSCRTAEAEVLGGGQPRRVVVAGGKGRFRPQNRGEELRYILFLFL